MAQAETKRGEVISGYVTAIYSTKAADWYTETTERQAIAEALASYVLEAYFKREA